MEARWRHERGPPEGRRHGGAEGSGRRRWPREGEDGLVPESGGARERVEGEIERREEREALLLSLSVWEAARGRRREGDGDRAMGVWRRRTRTKGEMGIERWSG